MLEKNISVTLILTENRIAIATGVNIELKCKVGLT
jgi:hypothetical protein